MSDFRFPNKFVGFAVGMGIGAALGILFAPRSGEETREFLADGARDAIDGAVTTGKTISRRAKRAVSDVAERVMDVANAGEEAYTRAKTA